MNLKLPKKGPELKLGELKIPGVLEDIYYDLRERHLLPLVVLLLVAVIAVPILLSKDSEAEETPQPAPVTAGSSNSDLIVAKAAPGLREYKQRFEGRVARNPFKQQYVEEEGEAAGAGTPQEATIESGSTETGPPAVNESEPGGGGGSDIPDEEPNRSHLTYYSWVIDARVSFGSASTEEGQDETKSAADSTVRKDLPEYTSLPSRKVPALTFVGVSKDEKRALMLVSDKVTGLFGEGTCVQGTERCQLVALEPGFPVTVVYGANSRTYHVELRKIRLVTTSKLNKAPLGNRKNGGKGKRQQEADGRASGSSAHVQRPILPPSSTEVGGDQLVAGK